MSTSILTTSLFALAMAGGQTEGTSVPSIVITLENAQSGNATFLTPPWIGIHDGTFDTYDGGSPASVPLGGDEIERLAEDGNNGPLSATFAAVLPNAPQVVGVPGPNGPLGPRQRTSVTLNVNPAVDRYFSYASMIIPSNDAFIANGNPMAHPLFDASGVFIGRDFIVSGDETNDAGTEVNDELPANVAFLNQAAPDTGVVEMLPVTTPSPGFAPPGALTFPSGILNYPVFGNGDFNDSDDRLLSVRFRYVDLGGTVQYMTELSNDQEVQADEVVTGATGMAVLQSRGASLLTLLATTQGLTGPVMAAHLHLGQEGSNGPVIVDLSNGINGRNVRAAVTQGDLTGPMDGASFVDFLNEVAAGNVYLNVHTMAFPEGEVRGQVRLAD